MRRALSLTALWCGCTVARPSVDQALAQYAAKIQAMNPTEIGASYTADGEMVSPGTPPLVGPAAIAEHLQSFSAFHVLEERMTPDLTTQTGDTAEQRGTYFQRVTLPSAETIEVSGRFQADWRFVDGQWRLRRLEAIPSKK
jgi:ketosteroid isomerase-like protein